MTRSDKRKFHFIYRTTCLSTGRYYIGMHSTDDLDDGYVGSGYRIRRSVEKYGITAHIREIVEDCSIQGRVFLREREKFHVDQKVLDDPLCMNIARGGEGGWEFVQKNKLMVMQNKHHPKYTKVLKNLENGRKKPWPKDIWLGRKHSVASKEKMSKTKIERQTGVGMKNSQFGTRWVFHPLLQKAVKCKHDEVESKLFQGWRLGRK